jgi:NitT/TauT family transport system ATP-binding protein
MTVFENVAFGLRIRKERRDRIEETVGALLRKLSLWDFRARFPKELSGGMRQRVAIARALALDAPTLLFDEPFGALDALTRRSLQEELLRVWSELRKTALFVTHSIEESIYLADRVVVMTYRPGTVKRIVPIELPRPRDAQSAGFAAIARQLTQLVMEEQERHETEERSG